MAAGFFITDQSFVGKCHPSARLVALFLSCIPPLLLDKPLPSAIMLAIYAIAALAFGAWKNLWRVKWLIVVFILVTIILWPLFYPSSGQPLFRFGPLAPSLEAIFFGLSMGLRLVTFLVSGIIFLSATRIEDITYGLQKLGMPYRMSFALSLAFRLTPLFMDTATHISAAQKVRGLDLESVGFFARLKGYVAIIAPVLIAALRRSDGLALALDSKGFGGPASRTSIVDYSVSWRDPFLLGFLLLLTAGCLAVKLKFFAF